MLDVCRDVRDPMRWITNEKRMGGEGKGKGGREREGEERERGTHGQRRREGRR